MRLDQIIVALLVVGAVALVLYLHHLGKSSKKDTKAT